MATNMLPKRRDLPLGVRLAKRGDPTPRGSIDSCPDELQLFMFSIIHIKKKREKKEKKNPSKIEVCIYDKKNLNKYVETRHEMIK